MIEVPIKVISEANKCEHWTKTHQRKKIQKSLTKFYLNLMPFQVKIPVKITFVRCAPRILDDDNLVSAFKTIRDTVASHIFPGKKPGQADNTEQIQWCYSQEKQSKKYSIKIIFENL